MSEDEGTTPEDAAGMDGLTDERTDHAETGGDDVERDTAVEAEPEPDGSAGTTETEGAATGDDSEDDDTVPDELVDKVADREPETIAEDLHELETERDELDAALEAAEERADDLESRLKRKQADFENYKKRQERRREEERQRATEDLVRRLLDVRDNLQRALDQDEDVDIRDGVESTLRQFDDVLERENVDRIEPAPGADVDPERHEVLTTVEADTAAGTVAECYRPGYVMAGTVIRPAQVTVSDGDSEDATDA